MELKLNLFTSKKLKRGTLSLLLTAVFVAVVIVVNIVAGLLLERFVPPVDLSADNIYSIGKKTLDYLEKINDEVTITVMSRENDFINTANFKEYYKQANEILKRFAAANENITLDYLDLLSNPDFAAKYDGLTEGTIVVESKTTGRYKLLDSKQYFTFSFYDMSSGEQISEQDAAALYNAGYGEYIHQDISASAESALLTAILSVTDDNPIYVAMTTGYGENKNMSLMSLLDKNAYNVSEIDIITTDITALEQELDFLIINAPATDYTDASIAKLSEWLDNDGKFGKTLLYLAHENAETPKLDAFLSEEWGISVERSWVVQMNMQFISGNPSLSGLAVQYFQPKDFAENLNPEYHVLGSVLRHVKQSFEAWQNIETEVILSSFNGAVIATFEDASDASFDVNSLPKGAQSIGVISRKIRFKQVSDIESEEVTSNVIAFGGQDVFSGSFLEMRNANNAEYLINMLHSISGKNLEITIAPKSFSVTTFEITEKQTKQLGVVFVIVLPLAVLVTGIVIWLRRRYK